MIIHVSNAFAKQLKCQVSLPDKRVPQSGSLESWSADILRITGEGTYAVVMNDASLSTIVIPLKGTKKFEDFFLTFLGHVTAFFDQHGKKFDPSNQSVIVLARSDRSIIGTMNDAKFIIRDSAEYDLTLTGDIDWGDIEKELNNTPYSRIGMDTPEGRLRELLAE